MFGYIRPIKGELYVKDSELYSSIYCGLCRYGGKNISHITRWILNYDFVLLALLRMSFSKEEVCVEKKRCPYKLKKKNCACADKSYSFVCSAFGLLTYEKIKDDISDEKGFKKFLRIISLPIFKRIGKKSDNFDGLKNIIEKGISYTRTIENDKCISPDRAADGFGTMMKEIVSYGLDGNEKLIAENCGYHVGRYIYLIDALDDIEQDERTHNYNPFIMHYGSAENALNNMEQIKETLFDSLNAFSNYYALSINGSLNSIDRIIFNIIELGGRQAVEHVCERKNKK